MFPSLQWACWTFAVLGIFSFHSNRHVAFWLFWASSPFIQMGMLRFGCCGFLFLHEVGHVAFGNFGACFLKQMGMSHIGWFGHVVLSLTFPIATLQQPKTIFWPNGPEPHCEALKLANFRNAAEKCKNRKIQKISKIFIKIQKFSKSQKIF